MLDRRTLLRQLALVPVPALWPVTTQASHKRVRTESRILVPSEQVVTIPPRPSQLPSLSREEQQHPALPRELHRLLPIVPEFVTSNVLPNSDYNVSVGKLESLLAITDLLCKLYPAADYEAWLQGLIQREAFSSSGFGEGWGLVHQFRGPELHSRCSKDRPIESSPIRSPLGDCWVFLAPQGLEYDALDGKPVYVLFATVMPVAELIHSNGAGCVALEQLHMRRISQVLREANLEPPELARCSPQQVSRIINSFDEPQRWEVEYRSILEKYFRQPQNHGRSRF